MCLCVCRRMQLFNLFSDIVALKYVKTRLRVEKLRSDVEEVIGTVRYKRSNLCTSESNDLYASVLIASHIVCILVTTFTSGKAW